VGSINERFEANVDRTGEHHLWCGYVAPDGTAQIRINGRLTTARRLAWELAHGPLPRGVNVAGCTDEPRCVRVEHLHAGRRARARDERRPQPRARGTGSLQQIRPGVWKVSVATATGRHSRTIHGTRADADSALATLHDEAVGPAASLNALAARFFAHTETIGRTPHTVRRYRQLWRDWLAPSLGSTQPNDLHPAQIEATLAAMANAGQSASSVRQSATVIASLCRWAQDTGLANYNPALAARLPDGHSITTRRR
jgi:hypothetical protein